MTDLSIWDSDYVINASSSSDEWNEDTTLSTMIEAADWAIVHNELIPIPSYQDNPIYWRERSRLYRNRPHNKSKIKTRSANRRSRVLNQPSTLTNDQWLNALDYFGNKCAVCERTRDFWTTLAQDHWIPINKGGATIAKNIVPLCHPLQDAPTGQLYCNSSKRDSEATVWLEKRFGKRKAAEILKRIDSYFATLATDEQITELRELDKVRALRKVFG